VATLTLRVSTHIFVSGQDGSLSTSTRTLTTLPPTAWPRTPPTTASREAMGEPGVGRPNGDRLERARQRGFVEIVNVCGLRTAQA
jgi:hypothetical protein